MKIENRQQLLLVLTLGVLALFIGDKLIVSPLVSAYKSRSETIRNLKKQVADGTSLIRREQAVRSRWGQMRTNALPNSPSQAQEHILKAFENWSQESGASINAITPQWKNDSDEYKTLVCRVDASGSLWTLSRFIYDIENDPMGLKIESADFSSRDNTGRELTLGLQVSGLVLSSQAN